ncbi:MAG: alpha/beta hydrolase [Rhodospirillaceae bacterium]|nr:alpha/beta hydrolase [Rhodospirillaceae bacterium]
MATFHSEDFHFRTVGGIELLARHYRPASQGPHPYIIDAHGGAWRNGDRLDNAVIHTDFAANGIGVFALDFRLSGQAQFPAPVQDVNYGIRWFKENKTKIGAETLSIGGLGSSSGGQIMGLNAFRPNDTDYAIDARELKDDASLAFFIACWPILDPLARFRMAQDEGIDRLVDAHHAYFPDETAMTTGNPAQIVANGKATHRPPMILLQGTADGNIKHERADIFADSYKQAGGLIDVHKFEDAPHSFIAADPESNNAQTALELMREFVFAQTG